MLNWLFGSFDAANPVFSQSKPNTTFPSIPKAFTVQRTKQAFSKADTSIAAGITVAADNACVSARVIRYQLQNFHFFSLVLWEIESLYQSKDVVNLQKSIGCQRLTQYYLKYVFYSFLIILQFLQPDYQHSGHVVYIQ